jgi:hypothetical protein
VWTPVEQRRNGVVGLPKQDYRLAEQAPSERLVPDFAAPSGRVPVISCELSHGSPPVSGSGIVEGMG